MRLFLFIIVMSKVNLNDYVCAVPFTSLEIMEKQRHLCCSSWLLNPLPEKSSVKDAWFSKEANNVRDSMLDGTFKYCSKTQCPVLNQLVTKGPVGKIDPIYRKDSLPTDLLKKIELYKNDILYPTIVQFSFDRSCNLKCPSCRVSIITASSKKITEVELTIQEIENTFGKYIETLYITGSGDPFISVGFRNFMHNLDSKKWPKLKNIHLHTNATKWNEKWWKFIEPAHKYIRSCEISIDAATKDTYENKTRIGGNWDELMDNLKFISTLPKLKRIKTSFVVQQSNYTEMKDFYEMMIDIFKSKAEVFFGRINNWGTFTDEVFFTHKVWDKAHPEHQLFVDEVNKVIPAKQCWHNLQEFVKTAKSVI